MEKLVEKPVAQALTGIEQALCLLNEALILLRSGGLVLHEEVTAEQVDRIHERIEAAHTEIRLLDRQHQHVELVPGGEKPVVKLIRLSAEAAEMLAHRRKLDAELADLQQRTLATMQHRLLEMAAAWGDVDTYNQNRLEELAKECASVSRMLVTDMVPFEPEA